MGVHQHADEVVFVIVESVEHAAADVIDAGLHSAVHRLCVVGVVALRTGRMELFVSLLVVGFLEQDVGADAGILELLVILHCGRCDVDIDPADRAVLVLDAVDGLDALQDVLDGIFARVLTGFDGEPLVSHILQSDDLFADLFLGQLLARDGFVLSVVRTVDTAVHAVVGEIEWREHDDAVAVEMLLDFLAQVENLPDDIRVFAFEQGSGLCVRETFVLPAFIKDDLHQFQVILVSLRKSKRGFDFFIVDKFFCFFRCAVVFSH